MLEQARKFKFGALLSFLDDAISEKLSLSPSSTFRFLFLSSSTIQENQIDFYHAAIHFEAELPNVNKQMRLHIARHLRKLITDSNDIHKQGEKRILTHHRNKEIFKHVIENGRPEFFKKLVEDLIED